MGVLPCLDPAWELMLKEIFIKLNPDINDFYELEMEESLFPSPRQMIPGLKKWTTLKGWKKTECTWLEILIKNNLIHFSQEAFLNSVEWESYFKASAPQKMKLHFAHYSMSITISHFSSLRPNRRGDSYQGGPSRTDRAHMSCSHRSDCTGLNNPVLCPPMCRCLSSAQDHFLSS